MVAMNHEGVEVMSKVEIYTTPFCFFCIRAKHLLDRKGVPYEETNVTGNPSLRQELRERTGSHTVPQIFIDGVSIGGCDELHALEHTGRLDPLLAANS